MIRAGFQNLIQTPVIRQIFSLVPLTRKHSALSPAHIKFLLTHTCVFTVTSDTGGGRHTCTYLERNIEVLPGTVSPTAKLKKGGRKKPETAKFPCSGTYKLFSSCSASNPSKQLQSVGSQTSWTQTFSLLKRNKAAAALHMCNCLGLFWNPVYT